MISYASIDRIEENKDINHRIAVCEVELVDAKESVRMKCKDKQTYFVELPLEEIMLSAGIVKEGDILVVEHKNQIIFKIYGKNEEEKARRIATVNRLLKIAKKRK